MERWAGKVAFVTGVTSGIGEAIAESLVNHKLKVVGLARREDRLQGLKKKWSEKGGKFFPINTDLRSEDEILKAFKWVQENLGGVHILVNNAGVLHVKKIEEQSTENWKQIYDINVLALQICSREALRSMKVNNVTDGHIINISSVAAHMSSPLPEMVTYFASKRAVNCISAGLRNELALSKSDIRVTNICPGLVETEIFGNENLLSQRDKKIALKPSDVAETVVFALQVAPHVLISELIVLPVRDIAQDAEALNIFKSDGK